MIILIGADVMGTERNMDLFRQGSVEELVGNELYALLQASDALLFNIEGPLTDGWTPIKKAGSPNGNLRLEEAAINGIKALHPAFVTLANNHILDQGREGLNRTRELLNAASIPFGGVGDTLAEASKTSYITVSGRTIGIYCCAEHEFTIASAHSPGANPFDPLESLDHIEEARKRCDYLIVLYHGGREFYRYPSPELQHRFRRMADKGADLVVAQHTHCIGCYEEWKGSTLVYGQGNFIFDYRDDEYWNSGMLIAVELSDSGEAGRLAPAVSFIPFTKADGKIRKADDKQARELIKAFLDRSEEVKDPQIVADRYNDYTAGKLQDLLRFYHGSSFLFRVLNKLAGMLGKRDYIYSHYPEKSLLSLLNMVECEAHSEAAAQGIRRRLGL